MQKNITQLNEQQLREELIDAYSFMPAPTPEPEDVRHLKRELYRRGLQRDDVVTLAITGVIRRQRRAS